MFWRIVRAAHLILVTAMLLAIVFVLFWFLVRHPAPLSAGATFSAVDLITIVLSAVTVVLAALAIALAIAGAVGYLTIKDAVVSAAEREAARVAEKVVRDVAPRVAEEAAVIASGRDMTAGDRIADAEQGENVSES